MKTVEEQFANIQKTDIFICPTDTVYGISTFAHAKALVNRIRDIKQRSGEMGFIVLIPDIASLADFGVTLTKNTQAFLEKNWPGRLSVVIERVSHKFDYLHGNQKGIAFRVPDYTPLRHFLKDFGPIVSTSANLHGEPTVQSIKEAKNIFAGAIDVYVDGGELQGEPSTLIKLLR